jgi:CelD/BcsL family acetyltransferase involved in cellulose biosynthesis
MRALMPSVLRRLASEPSLSWDYILLRRTLPDSCAVRCLVAIPGFPSWARRSGAFHYHPLASYDSLLAALPSRYRKNVRRYRKRADELGVTYHTAQSREECEVLFQEFLQVEASGWKGEDGAGTAIALDPGLRRFYEALMQRFGDRGQCRICVIRHEARPIAAGFGLALNQTAYRMKWAYDESYARISPGTLLHWHILENACDDPNLRWLNMISDAPWHIQWAPITDDVHDIAVFRPGLAGRIASTEQEVLSQVRMWRRRAIDRWIVTEGGRRRIAWPSRRLA